MAGYIGAKVGTVTANAADIKGDISATDTTPEITLKNTTETDADGSRGGKITFKGEQSGGEESTLANIQASHDGTADDEKGDLIFRTNDGSDGASPTERMRIDSAGAVTFTSNDTSDQFVIQNNDTGSGSAPDMVLYRNSASPADGDTIGRVDYRGEDDGGTARDYVTLYSKISDASTGTPAGSFHIQTRNGTNQTDRLMVDGSGNVGINESSPDQQFHVNGGAANVVAKFESTDPFAAIMFTDDTGNAELGCNGNDIVFMPAGTEKFRVLNDGRFKTSDTSYVQFTGAIHSSETRYYKLINYASGYMLDAVIFMQSNRNGGFNQTAGYRNYNAAIGGYSNALYGPLTATGDSGETGNMTLYAGSDEAIYLKTTPSTYGGTVNGVIIGRIRTWNYDGTYVTSAP